jgi:hypothetical protein
MCKQLVLVLTISCLLGAVGPAFSAPVYKHSGCAKAAKTKFPDDRVARKQFKHWCNDQWKLYKSAHPA